MSGKIRTAACAMLAAAGLTGCAGLNGYSVRDEAAVQQGVLGDVVHLGATLCLDDDLDTADGGGATALPGAQKRGLANVVKGDGACDASPHQAGFSTGFADDGGVQFFTAFLVPDNATAPATATAHLPAAFDPATVTLTRKPSLDETLGQARPAPAGQRWVGYISPVVGEAARDGEEPADVAAGLQRVADADEPPATDASGDWSVDADFTFARGDGGLPAPAAFAHAVVGGVRMAYPESIYDGVDPTTLDSSSSEGWGLQLLDTRPVDCQEYRGFPYPSAYGVELGSLGTNDRGMPYIPTTLCGRTSAGGSLALKDLRGSGGTATAAPGTTATVPFTLRYVGDAGPSFALGASSAVPGAVVSASPTTLTPAGAGFEDAAVRVDVPAGTPAGAYTVTLTATAGGTLRALTGTLNVGAPGTVTGQGGASPDDGTGLVTASSTGARTRRLLEFRGFDRSGVGPDGKSINLGDVLCHKLHGTCGWVTVQLSVRWEQLHDGAEVARAAARQRVRMVVIGRAQLSVPARARRRVKVTLPAGVLKRLGAGEVLHAVAAVRAASDRTPLTHRIALRRG